MNKKLWLYGVTLDTQGIIRAMQLTENLRIKKISLVRFKKGVISATSDFLLKSELETLSIQSSTICSDDALALANFVRGSKLLVLELARCVLEPNALLTIIGSIKGSLLQHIKLNKCFIGIDEARTIADIMISPHMIKLFFYKCTFQEYTLSLILCTIKESTLQTLTLGDIEFNDEEVAAIVDCIACDAGSTLTKLSLVASSTASNKKSAITKAICDCSLQTVDVRFTSFFYDIVDVLKIIEHSSIKKFKFDIYNFTTEEIVIIMDAIKRNPSFEHISFIHITMSDYMLTKVCDLIENSALTSLYGCDLNSQQLCKLVTSVKKSSIVSLGLSVKYDTDWNILNIYDLLKDHNLIKLDLFLFGMTNEIIKSMLPIIKDSSLIKFDSNFWEMDSDIEAELDQMLDEQRARSNRFHNTKSAMSHFIHIKN